MWPRRGPGLDVHLLTGTSEWGAEHGPQFPFAKAGPHPPARPQRAVDSLPTVASTWVTEDGPGSVAPSAAVTWTPQHLCAWLLGLGLSGLGLWVPVTVFVSRLSSGRRRQRARESLDRRHVLLEMREPEGASSASVTPMSRRGPWFPVPAACWGAGV